MTLGLVIQVVFRIGWRAPRSCSLPLCSSSALLAAKAPRWPAGGKCEGHPAFDATSVPSPVWEGEDIGSSTPRGRAFGWLTYKW